VFVQKLGELPYYSCDVPAQENILRRPTSLLQEIHKLTPYVEVMTAHDPVCFFYQIWYGMCTKLCDFHFVDYCNKS
jgi:hypothetical protein